MNTSSAALIRNVLFFVQGALFALLISRILGLYLPNPVFLALGAAFGLCGLIQVVQFARSGEVGARKWWFIATGASAAGIVLGAILHNVGAMLNSVVLGMLFFGLAVLVLPVVFVGSWFGSLVLMGAGAHGVSKHRKRLAGLAAALAVGALASVIVLNMNGEGYTVSSEVLRAPDREIRRILVTVEVDPALVPVFRHSFQHSLVAAFSSNGIEASLAALPDSGATTAGDPADRSHADGDLMHVSIEPLYRTHRDGYEVIVGTVFEAKLIEAASGEDAWRLAGTVDYIAEQFFKQHGFKAHDGIKKEFAWHTSAAIVNTFMVDVAHRESVRIYTTTEERELHGQRVD